MKRSLVIGKVNAGKTLFCIQFAKYMGIGDLQWLVERTDGKTEWKRMSLAEAERYLSGSDAHRTRHLQSITVDVPRGKTFRPVQLTDSTGLTDGIHPEPDVREAMAQTLGAMTQAHVILHIVDAADIGRLAVDVRHNTEFGESWSNLDQQLAEFGMKQEGYLLLANKMDLPDAKAGYRYLCKRFSRHSVIPVSAKEGTGFREVKQHVWRYA